MSSVVYVSKICTRTWANNNTHTAFKYESARGSKMRPSFQNASTTGPEEGTEEKLKPPVFEIISETQAHQPFPNVRAPRVPPRSEGDKEDGSSGGGGESRGGSLGRKLVSTTF